MIDPDATGALSPTPAPPGPNLIDVPRRLGSGGERSALHGSDGKRHGPVPLRSEEHTSELQSLMRHSYAVFCLKKKTKTQYKHTNIIINTINKIHRLHHKPMRGPRHINIQ